MNPKTQGITLIAAFILMAAGHVCLAFFTLRAQTWLLLGLFAGVFMLYAFLCRCKWNSKQMIWLLIGAVGLRVIWLFAFPQLSDDYARFLWDGRLTAAGFNPFNYLPAEIMKGSTPASALSDAKLYAALNSPDYFTLYPPLLQGIFAFTAKMAPHNIYWGVVLLKVPVLLAETASLFLLTRLCKAWIIPQKSVLLYALNPLIIAELTGNVHYEGIVIFFLLAALWCWQNARFALSILCFTGAVITKLVPLIFLPILFCYFRPKRGFVFCGNVLVLFALSWLPFVDAALIRHVSSSIGLYFQSFEFNGSIYYFVRDFVYHFTHEIEIEIIAPVLALISTLLMLLYAFTRRKPIATADLPKHFIITLTIYLAFSTMVHPWYMTPLVVLCIFTPFRFPLVWSAIILSSYYEYHTEPPVESNVQLWIEYLVVTAAICVDIFRIRKRGFALTAMNPATLK